MKQRQRKKSRGTRGKRLEKKKESRVGSRARTERPKAKTQTRS